MTSEIYSAVCGGPGPSLPDDAPWTRLDNSANLSSPCQLYQAALAMCKSDIICMVHDDVTVHDPNWMERIHWQFACDDNVVAVGLGGALGLGNRDLYRKPFNIRNMARIGYISNQDDAETHGNRFLGCERVAVTEQFCMAIRTDWLRSIGGWPVDHLTHHLLDAFIACEAARAHREIWMVGAACHHAGGASSTSSLYRGAKWLQGSSLEQDHILPHLWIYENYPDVLPIVTA